MNLINALLRKKENPYYIKLRNCLLRQKITYQMSKAYFLFGLAYHENIISEIKNAINNNELKKVKNSSTYDVTKDNVELYLLQDNNENLLIVILLDYYELTTPEKIIDAIPVQIVDVEKELIFEKK